MGLAVLEHRAVEPIVFAQEGFGPVVLGHKVDTLVSLRHRGFVPGALGRQDTEPVDPGQEDSALAIAGFDLDHVPARVDLVDTYTRVTTAQVGFSIEKFVLVRVWVERYAEHIASAAAACCNCRKD